MTPVSEADGLRAPQPSQPRPPPTDAAITKASSHRPYEPATDNCSAPSHSGPSHQLRAKAFPNLLFALRPAP
ncbi:hypothetical protein E4U09_005248, partial [Claviceps aff. purpurea]